MALARAMLMAAHGTVTAAASLSTAVSSANPRVVAAVARRLVEAGRSTQAWLVIDRRRDVRWSRALFAEMADLLSDDEAITSFIAFVEEPSSRLPLADRREITARASVAGGRMAFERGEFATARAAFEVADTRQSSAWTATWLARTEVALSSFDEARQHAQAALVHDSSYRPALLTLADIDTRVGKPAAAVEWLTHVAVDPRATFQELTAVWDRLDRLGAPRQAMSVAERLVEEAAQESVEASARHAVSMWKLDDRDAADALVRPMEDRFDARAIRALAFYLGRTGRSTAAYGVLAAVTIFVRGASAMAELVEALLRDGHHRLARQALDRARGVFPSAPALTRIAIDGMNSNSGA